MTKRVTVLIVVSALFAAATTGSSDKFVESEVPDNYVGPAIDWGESAESQQDHRDLDWYDPKGQPVNQFAAQFGVDTDTAIALLRWQRDLNGRNGDFQILASYGLARIVGPSPTNGGGGLEVFLKNPTQEDLAVVESLPKPPLGEVVVRKAFFTAAEALELVDREQARFRNQVGDDAFVVVTTDWETGVIVGEVRERPPTTEGHGCPSVRRPEALPTVVGL